MDEIKDIEKKDSAPRFLKDTPVRSHAFGDNVSGERAYQRAERIAAAVHLVTSHVPEREPARIRARGASLDLLSGVLGLRDEMRSAGSAPLIAVQGTIRKLISLMRVLSVAGRLSVQNAEALIGALDDLGVFLVSSRRTPLSESVSLSREDFIEPANATRIRRQEPSSAFWRGPLKDIKGQKGRVSDKSKGHIRTQNVLSVLGSKSELGIRDIIAHLPEYSEKMIQRELKGLVALGRVKKTGSKRWSIYSLA